jgi:hypothetical protein
MRIEPVFLFDRSVPGAHNQLHVSLTDARVASTGSRPNGISGIRT